MTEQEIDDSMFEKGYRFKLTPRDRSFLPLYTKKISTIADLLHDYYHGVLFEMHVMRPPTRDD